ncbi:MAG: hypothetical protein KDB07_06830, partial [Planctomycetes bacterium]|nr:hypothetical protein [Planctomycetota bacterium]
LSQSGSASHTPASVNAVQGLASFTTANAITLFGPVSGAVTLSFADTNLGLVNLSATPLTTGVTLGVDADAVFSETSSATSINSTTAYQSLWVINGVDAGALDGLPTRVNSLTYDVSVTGGFAATDFEWQLSVGGGAGVPSTSVSASTVSFSASPLASIANLGSLSFNLLARAAVSDSTSLDGVVIAVSLAPSNIVMASGTTQLSASQAALSTSNDAEVDVVASQLRFVLGNTPSLSQTLGVGFTTQVEYTDAAGNRDLDVTNVNTITPMVSAGAIVQPAGAIPAMSGVVDFSAGAAIRVTNAGVLAGVSLSFIDNITAPDLSASPLVLMGMNFDVASEVTFSNAINVNDGVDSILHRASAGGVERTVMRFTVTDAGGDAAPFEGANVIANLTSDTSANGANPNDFVWRIKGNGLPAAGVVGNVGGTSPNWTLTFNLGGTPMSVANAGAQSYDITTRMVADSPANGTTDKETFAALSISTSNVTTTGGGSSTPMAGQTVSRSSALVYNVRASQLEIISQPASSAVID